jgi:PAS domain S-box-containing protein
MITQLNHHLAVPPNFITTLSRFPASKVGPSLLSSLQSAMDGVVIVDSKRHIVLVNQRVERMFGYPARQLLEKPLDILLPSRTGSEQRRRLERLPLIRPNNRRDKLELKCVRADGEPLFFNASISHVTVHGQLFTALVLHDRSMHVQSHEAKHRLLKAMELRRRAVSSHQANEMEKRRFSKKLYDDIGQGLSVLKLDLDWLENSLANTNERLPARFAQMRGLLDNVITTTKSMASALRPPLLDDFGLLPAVEWMAENFRKKNAIACLVESEGLVTKLGDPIESAVLRMVQEGLSNIEKHAHASHAKIVLKLASSQLDVMIQDDGIGMESGSENKAGCYGLIAMQERIFVLGGTIAIENIKSGGVAIRASIPIDPALAADPLFHPPTTHL